MSFDKVQMGQRTILIGELFGSTTHLEIILNCWSLKIT